MNYFIQNISFENVFVVKERKPDFLKKHVAVKINTVLIYIWLTYCEQ